MKYRVLSWIAVLLLFFCACDTSANTNLLNRVVELMDSGDWVAAQEACELYVQEVPEDEYGWTILGNIHETFDEDSLAKTAYFKALKLNSDREEALTGLGILSRKAGNYEEATVFYRRALKANPNYAQAISSLLVIELKRKNLAEAVRLGEQSRNLDAEDPAVAANLAVAYHYQGDTLNRNRMYEVAKSLQYKNLENLQLIFDGELTIFDD